MGRGKKGEGSAQVLARRYLAQDTLAVYERTQVCLGLGKRAACDLVFTQGSVRCWASGSFIQMKIKCSFG